LSACGRALGAPSGPPAPQTTPAATCTLGETRLQSVDTALIVFRATGMAPEQCAVRLVAATLRPWPASSPDRWTVVISLTDTGVTASRIGSDDARDAIDAAVALMVTEDLELSTYAAARPGLDVTPLPWDRTYLSLTRSSIGSLGGERTSEAVRVDARPAEALSCDTVVNPTASEGAQSPGSRVVYDAGDRTAEELAERIVAIAGDSAVATGLPTADFESALRAGDALAYIISVPRFADQRCDAVAALARRAPWLTPHSIVPLVDTRAHAIVPRSPRP
jgi:hypothetical protein